MHATDGSETDSSGNQPEKKKKESAGPKKRLHRIATVCQQQGVSDRRVAQRLGISVAEVRYQQHELTDLKLTDVYRWQSVLEVPVADLLVEPDLSLSMPIQARARLLRLMKTVRAISETVDSVTVRRLAEGIADQLVEIMPELAEVGAWHSVGQRRGPEELGRIIERQLPEDMFNLRRRRSR